MDAPRDAKILEYTRAGEQVEQASKTDGTQPPGQRGAKCDVGCCSRFSDRVWWGVEGRKDARLAIYGRGDVV
ncbi:hypothetical protein XFPR_06410 [Xylella fastidiosa]|uniref:hypothetical protein n=1 Tax=Xylella fastidiosa TaxID=2371 RepID=UPI0003D2AB2A|nr:hypothetical protein [Xylella fastidiosa]ALR04288.1 hypothetical protein XFPR_06410 [Xylella fastidiosa]KXB20228.1 hypothetical protein ADT30_08175 [Xylella fastidiosa]OJZ70650.1 hypothetical protein B375_0206315 [Xylella fastidiosa 6c]